VAHLELARLDGTDGLGLHFFAVVVQMQNVCLIAGRGGEERCDVHGRADPLQYTATVGNQAGADRIGGGDLGVGINGVCLDQRALPVFNNKWGADIDL